MTVTGETCRAARLERGWTVDQLAQRSGLAVLTIQKLEAGRTVPRFASTLALRKAFAAAPPAVASQQAA